MTLTLALSFHGILWHTRPFLWVTGSILACFHLHGGLLQMSFSTPGRDPLIPRPLLDKIYFMWFLFLTLCCSFVNNTAGWGCRSVLKVFASHTWGSRSNLCITAPERRKEIARKITFPNLFLAWGLRTIASLLSCHCGSLTITIRLRVGSWAGMGAVPSWVSLTSCEWRGTFIKWSEMEEGGKPFSNRRKLQMTND